METIYVTQKKFDELITVEKFPNPKVKIAKVGNEKKRVCVAGIIEIYPIGSSFDWHNVPQNCWIGTAKDGHFPTDLIAGVENRIYSEKTPLSKLTGYKYSTNLGTASDAFINKDAVASILQKNNFTVIFK